jgi:hypothetical protein
MSVDIVLHSLGGRSPDDGPDDVRLSAPGGPPPSPPPSIPSQKIRFKKVRVFISRAQLIDQFCTVEKCCEYDPGHPPYDNCFGFNNEDSADNNGMDSSYCNGYGKECLFNPKKPPLWWLQKRATTLCKLVVLGLATQKQCDCANTFANECPDPDELNDPSNPCFLEWRHTLELWRRTGARETDAHCSGTPGKLPPDFYQVQKIRLKLPQGSYIISEECIDMELDEVCAPCI